MSTIGSVTNWIGELKGGDPDAARRLWDRYCKRLVGLARKKLRAASCRVADEQDVGSEAFNSLCLGARDGRFPLLVDRDDLWGLLVKITVRKAADLIAYENAAKRKSRRPDAGRSDAGSVDQLIHSGPGPATLAIWREEYDCLLQSLGDDTLRHIAELSVAGYTIEEVAQKIGCSRSTIFRKLRLIKNILLTKLAP